MSDLSKTEDCVGEFAILWAFRYKFTVYTRRATAGGMDSEPTGQKEIHEAVFHIVAPTEALATAAYKYRVPAPTYEFISCERVCVVDAIVSIEKP